MSFIKYRVREVAADFGMTPKEVSEVIAKYFDKPMSFLIISHKITRSDLWSRSLPPPRSRSPSR